MEKLSPFYNVDIFGYVKFKFSWGFSWNQFFGASKIAPSWASYLESDLGWFWVILRRGGWFGCHKSSRILVVKQKKTAWSLGAHGSINQVPGFGMDFVRRTFGESVCDFGRDFWNKNHWRVEGLRSYSIWTRSKRKDKKVSIWTCRSCPGGSLPRIPGDEQRHRDLHFHRELSWSAGDFDFFGGGKKAGWHFGGNFWKLKSQNRRPNYSNQTGRLISKMSWRLRLVNYCSLPRYQWYHIFPFLNG